MNNSITDVFGIQVGHADDQETVTGCTVVLCEEGAVVGVDVRGRAPGTRETDLCRPGTLVERANAVVLTGGSAFGLESASGVMRYLYERGKGFETGIIPVPIVPAAVIFDLGIGSLVWPDADMGYAAAKSATAGPVARGCVGAGTGATVGKLLGPANAVKSGVGTASARVGNATVGAVMVVNASGDVLDRRTGQILAGARDPTTGSFLGSAEALLEAYDASGSAASNTTIGVVATDAPLSSEQTNHLASMAHDGLAQSIFPVHTMADGDTMFGLATGDGTGVSRGEIISLAVATVSVVRQAVIDAVLSATSTGGLPAASDLTPGSNR